ncbi:MAG: glycosyltransferase family 39 protein [Phycisphaerales bacterium]|nr:glycosyltransferase family 39 protein [Phycisphaerales bacterium]
MTGPQPQSTDARGRAARAWDSGLALILAVALARLIYLLWLCPYTLIEDEAHYWEWSRRLELSYYSKGPGVAWVIRAATELLGTHEWSIRLPAVVFGAFGAWCVAGLARDMVTYRRAGLVAAAVYMCMPAYSVLGVLITIDGPYLACWAWACWAGWRVMRRGSWTAWASLGLALGVGFLFKYTILLLAPGLAVGAWLARRDHAGAPRSGFAGPLAASACAAMGLVPVLLWNARHGWVTVHHLLGHLAVQGGDVSTAQSEPWTPLWTLELLGTQAALAGPAILLAVYATVCARRERAEHPGDWAAARYLVCCGLPVLLFYLAVSLIAEPEGNWPISAWVSAAPLGALAFARAMPQYQSRLAAWRERGRPGWRPRLHRVMAWRWTVGVGIAVAIGGARADLFARLPWIGPLVPMGRLTDADVRARDAARIVAELHATTGLEPFVMAQHYGRASQLAYYMPGRPTVYSASAHTGGRTTQYDVWPQTDLANPDLLANLTGRPALLVGGETHHWEDAFDRVEDVGQLEGEHKKGRRIYLGYGFRGFESPHPTAPGEENGP